MEKRKEKGNKVGAVVEAVTEGVLINNSQLDTPSWFDTPFSILISEDVLRSQHQAWALRWSKSAISRLMWANLLCRYSQRCFSSW